MIIWASSGSLHLDEGGGLLRRYKRGWEYLGHVEDFDPPATLEDDHRELLGQWESRFDPRAEAEWSYRLDVLGR
jgi:hypothetical protein